jgi:hypothetical protein
VSSKVLASTMNVSFCTTYLHNYIRILHSKRKTFDELDEKRTFHSTRKIEKRQCKH